MRARARRATNDSGEVRILLGLLSRGDDVTLGEQDLLQDLPPLRRAAEQELEIHPEVLELLELRVLHDGARLRVALDRDALLVPADGLRLLEERRAHAREGAGLRRELPGRLVVLVERHRYACPSLQGSRARLTSLAGGVSSAASGFVPGFGFDLGADGSSARVTAAGSAGRVPRRPRTSPTSPAARLRSQR